MKVSQTILILLVNAAAGVSVFADTSAQCTLRFDAIWSAQTHPTDFPSGPHFSGLIGGTHNAQVVFWQPGDLATAGIQDMAELGAKSPFRDEIEAAISAGTAADEVSGGGLGVSPGTVSVAFSIDVEFPYLTVVTMIAPSPDWFVGIHGLLLFEGGRWIVQKVIDLPPYDAGTDSGITYMAPNLATSPAVPIAQITGHPFGGPTSLGTFTIDCTSSLISLHGFEDALD